MAIVVKKEPGESENRLIDKFRRKILADDLIREVKERSRYKKPALRRNEEKSMWRKRRKSRRSNQP